MTTDMFNLFFTVCISLASVALVEYGSIVQNISSMHILPIWLN